MYAAPAKLHFQFASNDEWVQTLEQVDLYRAASQPKSRQMFEADELLNDEAKKGPARLAAPGAVGQVAGINSRLDRRRNASRPSDPATVMGVSLRSVAPKYEYVGLAAMALTNRCCCAGETASVHGRMSRCGATRSG